MQYNVNDIMLICRINTVICIKKYRSWQLIGSQKLCISNNGGYLTFFLIVLFAYVNDINKLKVNIELISYKENIEQDDKTHKKMVPYTY